MEYGASGSADAAPLGRKILDAWLAPPPGTVLPSATVMPTRAAAPPVGQAPATTQPPSGATR